MDSIARLVEVVRAGDYWAVTIEFIKMLNDSILRSELTDAEYDSTVKTELPPIQ